MKKRILCFITCLVLLIAMFPTGSFAEWIENGEQCDICGEWDEGDNVCDTCGCHLNGFCEEYTHCRDCGRCFATGDSNFCPDCGYCYECAPHCNFCGRCPEDTGDLCDDCDVCEECADELGAHCSECGKCLYNGDECPEHGSSCGHCDECAADWTCNECGKCFFDNQDNFCETCHMCLDCAVNNMYHCGYCDGCCDGDVVCEYCGHCEDCAQSEGLHCPICEKCYEGETDRCHEDGDHCVECCYAEGWICPGCGECTEGNGIEICHDCGLCESCCAENSMDAGCSTGIICVESSEWDEHFCEECGKCYCEVERCDYCGLCTDCCALKSEAAGCSTGEVCIESPEWDNHICDGCNECFCNKDYCDYCGLCVDCCAGESSCSEGMCTHDTDYEVHFCSICGKCFHEVEQCETCAAQGVLICLECCAETDHTEAATDERLPQILRQPSDFHGQITDPDGESQYASFTVKLKNPAGTSYKWQVYQGSGWTDMSDIETYSSGTNTASMTVRIQSDACVVTRKYRCVLTNTYGSVNSNEASLVGEHLYKWTSVDDTYHILKCATDSGDDHYSGNNEKHHYGEWVIKTAATATTQGLKERKCKDCNHIQSLAIPKAHNHEWNSDTWVKDEDSHWHACKTAGCDSVTDKAPHSYDGTIVVTTEPTERTSGAGYKECTVCGYKANVTIPKLYHTHDFLKDSNASFNYGNIEGYTYGGYELYTSYDASYHWKLCRECVKEVSSGVYEGYVYEREPHNFLEWHIDTTENKMFRICHNCGYKQEKTLPSNTGATGSFLVTATRGKVSVNNSSFGDYVMAAPGNSLTFKAGDTYEGGAFQTWTNISIDLYKNGSKFSTGNLVGNGVKNPVQNVDLGTTTFSLTLPDPEIWEYIDNEDSGARWTFKYKSTVNIMANYGSCAHTNAAQDDSTAHEATCTVAGCTAAVVCPDCHAVVTPSEVIPASGHDYVLDQTTVREAECNKTGYEGDYVCSRCGTVKKGRKLDRLGHDYGDVQDIDESTCHSNGHKGRVCAHCGDVQITETLPRTDHTASGWHMDSEGHWKECANDGCGIVLGSKVFHTDRNGDFKCDTCNYDLTIYIVTYTDGVAGKTVFTDQVFELHYGDTTPEYEGTPSREGYKFKGWSPEVAEKVTGDAVYTARWQKKDKKPNPEEPTPDPEPSPEPGPAPEPAPDKPDGGDKGGTIVNPPAGGGEDAVPGKGDLTPVIEPVITEPSGEKAVETVEPEITAPTDEEKSEADLNEEEISGEKPGKDEEASQPQAPEGEPEPEKAVDEKGKSPWMWVGLGGILAVIIVGGAIAVSKKKENE